MRLAHQPPLPPLLLRIQASTSETFSDELLGDTSDSGSESEESLEFRSSTPVQLTLLDQDPGDKAADGGVQLAGKRKRDSTGDARGAMLPPLPLNAPFGHVRTWRATPALVPHAPMPRPWASNANDANALRLYTSASSTPAQGAQSHLRTREKEPTPSIAPSQYNRGTDPSIPPSEFTPNADLPVFSDDTVDWDTAADFQAASPLHGVDDADLLDQGADWAPDVGDDSDLSQARASPQAAQPHNVRDTGCFKVILRRPKPSHGPLQTPEPQQNNTTQLPRANARAQWATAKTPEPGRREAHSTRAGHDCTPEDTSQVAQILVALRSSPATTTAAKLSPRSYRAERRRRQIPAAVRPDFLEPVAAPVGAASPAPSSPLSEPESLGGSSSLEAEPPAIPPLTLAPADGSLRTLPAKFEIRANEFPGFYARYHVVSMRAHERPAYMQRLTQDTRALYTRSRANCRRTSDPRSFRATAGSEYRPRWRHGTAYMPP